MYRFPILLLSFYTGYYSHVLATPIDTDDIARSSMTFITGF